MILWQRYRWLLAAVLLSALWVAAQPLLLTRTQTLLPDEPAVRFLFDSPGTQTEWIDYQHDHWLCQSRPDQTSYGCIYNLALSEDYVQGQDFSDFDRLTLDIELSHRQPGSDLFFRHYDDAYSNPDDGNSAQYNHVILPLPAGRSRLTIDWDDFSVAGWWLNGRDLAPQYRQTSRANITVIGLSLGAQPPPADLEVQIHSIRAEGAIVSLQHWLLALGLAWMAGLGIWLGLAIRRHHRRTCANQQRLAQLVREHRQLHHQARQLRDTSQRDTLSGLLNRRGLHLQSESLAPDEECIAVVFLDIDAFKLINDTLGHNRGDGIIQLVAGLLDKASQPRDLLARWGGEEFVWLCAGCDERDGEWRAEAVRRQLAGLDIAVAPGHSVTLSAGVTLWRAGEPLKGAMERADRALYWAKNSGRNRVLVAPQHLEAQRAGR